MALGFEGFLGKGSKWGGGGCPGKTHVDVAMRVCIAKLHGATIHKHWTNTSSIITSAAINKSNIFGLNLTKQQKKLVKEKQTLEMCRNKKIKNIVVTYQY